MDKEQIQLVIEIARSYFVDLTIYDEVFLGNSIARRSSAININNPDDYCAHLRGNRAEAEIFFQSLRITYSRFFREPLVFALLEQWVIPGILRRVPSGSEIRVWSAGCSCGQEAYSLAMLLDEHVKSLDKDLRYRIFATDVSNTALATARAGVYTASDVKNVQLKYMQAYFTQHDGKYIVSPQLKQHVAFSHYDLLDATSASPPESIFGCFDIVCCSNLMMYYKKEMRLFILKKIERTMSKTGFLAVGEAERAFVKSNSGFQPISVPAAVFHKPGFSQPAGATGLIT